MQDQLPSQSALGVAITRARHQIQDTPLVFTDPLALRIVGAHDVTDHRLRIPRFESAVRRRMRSCVIARVRYAEDELEKAIKNSARQYVILGAGLDTYAYRSPHISTGLHVFEVDHPSTQQWKRQLLEQADIPKPENLTYIPVNFQNQSLAAGLQESGFRNDVPTFFSWLGVTMYLDHDSFLRTIGDIAAAAAPGSEIVFDYIVRPSSQNFIKRLVFHRIFRAFARIGEPLVGFFDPDRLKLDLESAGYTLIEDLGQDRINERFFKNRKDKLGVGSFNHFLKAGLG